MHSGQASLRLEGCWQVALAAGMQVAWSHAVACMVERLLDPSRRLVALFGCMAVGFGCVRLRIYPLSMLIRWGIALNFEALIIV